MLRRVKELTRGLESYAFWEERVGCGTGICYGCAVKRTKGEGYLRFCREGPVLRMSDIEI
jgi:dihydroorotate dehydrogenase electron transfer subunit